MKAARLGRTPAHEICLRKATLELPHVSAPVPRAIRKSASAMLSAAAQLFLLIRVALPL